MRRSAQQTRLLSLKTRDAPTEPHNLPVPEVGNIHGSAHSATLDALYRGACRVFGGALVADHFCLLLECDLGSLDETYAKCVPAVFPKLQLAHGCPGPGRTCRTSLPTWCN